MRKTIKKSLALVLSLLMILSIGQLGLAYVDPASCTHSYTKSYSLIKNADGTFDLNGSAYCASCNTRVNETVSATYYPRESQAPTCTTGGKAAYSAKFSKDLLNDEGVDFYIYKEDVDALGHDFTGDVVNNGNGTHSWKCANAGCTALGYVNDNGKSVEGSKPCTGGTATCTDKAICEVCNTAYGEEPSHNLTAIEAKAPTCQAPGNEAYWKCSKCGKYFKDANATEEWTGGEPVIAKLTHTPKKIYGLEKLLQR
ncbi:MAG: hypothetical protein IKR49_04435 [Clostridia bacterium]|nr:hypothetical protein [Clostridia bacterium]